MPIDFPDMVNVIVVNKVAFVHILGAGTIAAKQDAATAQTFDMVAGNFILLTMQVHTNRAASAVKKMTLINNAVLGSTQANQRVVFVEHVPVVLRPGIILGECIAVAVLKRETAKT